MDFEDALKAGGVSATLITIIGIGVKLFQKFCGNRVRSECCGKEGTVGVVVEPMSPRAPRPSLEVRVAPDTPPMPTRTADLSTKTPVASRTQSPSSAAAPAIDAPQPPPLAI